MNSRSAAAFAPAALAGHPIRRQIASARHARRPGAKRVSSMGGPIAGATRGEDELKLFALSFTAFFVCIYTLIF